MALDERVKRRQGQPWRVTGAGAGRDGVDRGAEARRDQRWHRAAKAIAHRPQQFSLVDGHRAVDADAGGACHGDLLFESWGGQSQHFEGGVDLRDSNGPRRGQLQANARPGQCLYSRRERAGGTLGRLLAGVRQRREDHGRRRGQWRRSCTSHTAGCVPTKCVTTWRIKSR